MVVDHLCEPLELAKQLRVFVKSLGRQEERSLSSELQSAADLLEQLDARIKRRDETIRELRRTVMLELLTLQFGGKEGDISRNELHKKAIEKMKRDELAIDEWREKAKVAEEEMKLSRQSHDALRLLYKTDRMKHLQDLDKMEYKNCELNNQLKSVSEDLKNNNIVMIGKDAIIEKQYESLQAFEEQVSTLSKQLSSLKTELCASNRMKESLTDEVNVLKTNLNGSSLIERLELVKEENISMNRVLADYKAGYNKLVQQNQDLTLEVANLRDILENAEVFDLEGSAKAHESQSKAKSSLVYKSHEVPASEYDEKEYNSNVAEGLTKSNRKRSSVYRIKGSFLRKSSCASHKGEPNNASDSFVPSNPESPLTRIQMRRLRESISCEAGAHHEIAASSKSIVDKECQVNIDSSQYANIRMGNEGEIIVKSLYKRISELEDVVAERDETINKLSVGSIEYKSNQDETNSVDDNNIRSDDPVVCFQCEHLREELARQEEVVEEFKRRITDLDQVVQLPGGELVSKETQCDHKSFVASAGVQTHLKTSDASTQSRHLVPVSSSKPLEDAWSNYVFKETLLLCKHVVKESQEKRKNGATDDLEGTECERTTIMHCRSLLASLQNLRKDILDEMKFRGGEFDTTRSRSFLRCLDVILHAFDGVINYSISAACHTKHAGHDSGRRADGVNTFTATLLTSPVTCQISKSSNAFGSSDKRVLFSQIQTDGKSSGNFGGGAPAGVLMSPGRKSPQSTEHMRYCRTKGMALFADDSSVMRRADESACDSFLEDSCEDDAASRDGLPSARDNDSSNHTERDLRDVAMLSDPNSNAFFTFSRPLSANIKKSSLSPRHSSGGVSYVRSNLRKSGGK